MWQPRPQPSLLRSRHVD